MTKYMIETKRLGLRPLIKEDIDLLAELDSDADVKKYFPGGAQTREQIDARLNDFISYYKENGLPCFAMFELNSRDFVGRAGFGLTETGETEVGYVLHKKFWNKGYASEALTALLEWAKKYISSDYIIAFAPENHLASQRVMEKCGMKHYKNDTAKGISCCFYRINNRELL